MRPPSRVPLAYYYDYGEGMDQNRYSAFERSEIESSMRESEIPKRKLEDKASTIIIIAVVVFFLLVFINLFVL